MPLLLEDVTRLGREGVGEEGALLTRLQLLPPTVASIDLNSPDVSGAVLVVEVLVVDVVLWTLTSGVIGVGVAMAVVWVEAASPGVSIKVGYVIEWLLVAVAKASAADEADSPNAMSSMGKAMKCADELKEDEVGPGGL